MEVDKGRLKVKTTKQGKLREGSFRVSERWRGRLMRQYFEVCCRISHAPSTCLKR